MSHLATVALTDQEVLKRLQRLGDALTASIGRETPSHLNPYRAPHRSLDDWRQQKRLLEEVAVFLSDDLTGRPAFVGWVSLYLKNVLLALLQSPRTAVSLGTASVLDCLVVRTSATNRAAVGTICSWFLSPLLRMAASPSLATAVSSAASRLLFSMANNCLLTLESLNTVFSACAAVSAPVRRCAVRVLQTYLQATRGSSYQLAINTYTEALHRVLREGVADADAEVRAAARRCLWTAHLVEPASTAALVRTLPPSVRRQLAEEQEVTMKELQTVVAAPAEVSVTPPTNSPTRAPRPAEKQLPAKASRTVTLKDELQAAAASRARAHSARPLSPPKAHCQLLLSAKDLPFNSYACPVTAGNLAGGRRAGLTPPRPMSLLASMGSTDWSVRRAALLHACAQCEKGELREDLSSVLSLVLPLLHDTHFRVVEAAQEFLRCSLRIHPVVTEECLKESLTALLSLVFENLNHTKSTVRDGAYVLLDVLTRRQGSAAGLLEAVLRCVDDVHGYAGEQRVAEFLVFFVTQHFSLFSQQSVMSAVVRCGVAHLSALQTDLSGAGHRAAASSLATAWSNVLGGVALACPDVFRDAYERLATAQKDTVRSALRQCFDVARSSPGVSPSTDLVCVFSAQLRQAFTAEEARHRGRGRSPGAAGPLHASPPLRQNSLQTVLPPILIELMALTGSDATASSASHLKENAEVVAVRAAQEPIDRTPARTQTISSRISTSPAVDEAVAAADVGTPFRNPLTTSTSFLDSPACGENARHVMDTPVRSEVHSRNPPAQFLHDWMSCRDSAAKRAALLRLTSALTHFTKRQKSGMGNFVGEAVVPPQCVPEEVERVLVLWEREVAGADYGTDHLLRWTIFEALGAVLSWSAACSAVARQLARVLAMCCHGIDDAFVEVQLQAAACLHSALLGTKFPSDLCFGAVASCLGMWVEGPARDLASPGWIELLQVLRCLFLQGCNTHTGTVANQTILGKSATKKGRDATVLTLTSSVLRRVVAVVHVCLGHCNPVVRLSAVLVLVALQCAMGETTAAPFLTALTPAQHRLVSVYRTKLLTSDKEAG